MKVKNTEVKATEGSVTSERQEESEAITSVKQESQIIAPESMNQEATTCTDHIEVNTQLT